METDIERWLNFAVKVEDKLHTLNNGIYSEQYITGISDLLGALRREAEIVMASPLLDKKDGYSRVNKLAQELRNTAHFAHVA